MAFEGLTEKLSAAFKKLRGKGRLSEADVKEAMKEIRMALLEADVNFKVVKQFVATVTERAIGSDVLESLTPAQMIVKIVNEELTALMGGENTKLTISPKPPTVVMLVGLNGAGKTTNGAKLAGFMKKQGKRPLLVACDTFRPAAITQLEVVGQQVDVPVFQMGQIDPVDIARAGIEHAKKHGNDIVFIDTAGRLHVDEELMEQLKVMKAAIDPTEILLIVDAMIGQDAVNAAKTFDEALDITGVMLTKLDGDARGGAALSIKAVTGKPIKFVGVGEKLYQVELFYPDRMASRILGMGDVLSLIEKAQQTFDAKKAAELEQKLRKNKFTLADFYDQLVQIKGMGSLSDIAGMLPGMNAKALEGASVDENALARTEATGYGVCYYTQEALRVLRNDSFEGKTVVISGSGNVATYAAQKAEQLGAKVVTVSDSNGYIYDPNGINVEVVKQIKEVERGRIKEYAERVPGSEYHEGSKGVWTVKGDIALPCATQNEVDGESAQKLVDNGVTVVVEGANMPSTPEAIEVYQKNGVLYGPAKAANAGGVAVSGLEMSQNSYRLSWTFEEVDAKLKSIMEEIVANSLAAAKEYGHEGDLMLGANAAGFVKVANAMVAQGVL